MDDKNSEIKMEKIAEDGMKDLPSSVGKFKIGDKAKGIEEINLFDTFESKEYEVVDTLDPTGHSLNYGGTTGLWVEKLLAPKGYGFEYCKSVSAPIMKTTKYLFGAISYTRQVGSESRVKFVFKKEVGKWRTIK